MDFVKVVPTICQKKIQQSWPCRREKKQVLDLPHVRTEKKYNCINCKVMYFLTLATCLILIFHSQTIAPSRFCHLAWWSLIIIKWRSWSNFSSNTPCPRPHLAIHFWHSVHFLDWSKDYYLQESRSHAILTRFFFFRLIVSDPFLHECTGFFILRSHSNFKTWILQANLDIQFRYP